VADRPSERSLRLLIAEDDTNFAKALEEFLAADDRVGVVGSATNGEEAVEMAGRLEPNVILMDIAMPRLDGLTAIRRIRATGSTAAIVVLTGSEGSIYGEALDAGADALVRKSEGVAALLPILFELTALIELARVPTSSFLPTSS
jgi:DNA-binding NarL/FixJ family response regulator